MDIFVFDNYVAEVNADAEQQFSIIRLTLLLQRYAVLDVCRTLDGIDDTPELDQNAIAHCFYETASVLVDGRTHDLVKLVINTGASCHVRKVCFRRPSRRL